MKKSIHIKLAKSEAEIKNCYRTLKELRPKIKLQSFTKKINKLKKYHYELVYIKDDQKIVSVAGFAVMESFYAEKFIYVFDLVTQKNQRSQQYGSRLINWLKLYAKDQGCRSLHLDSGVQRFDAHRFYFKHGMNIACYHFEIKI